MHNLIKSEVYKLFHGKELIICIAAVMLFSIIMIAFGGYENGKATLTTESREIIGLVICTLFAVSYIGKDFTAKTVHHALTSGNARSKVFCSKFISYSVACFILLLLNDIFMGFGYSAFYGWGESFAQQEMFFSFVYILVGILFDLCIVSIPFFICVLIQNNAVAMVTSFGAVALIIALSQMPWSYITERIAVHQGGSIDFIFLISFVVVTAVLNGLGVTVFRKQDIQ